MTVEFFQIVVLNSQGLELIIIFLINCFVDKRSENSETCPKSNQFIITYDKEKRKIKAFPNKTSKKEIKYNFQTRCNQLKLRNLNSCQLIFHPSLT